MVPSGRSLVLFNKLYTIAPGLSTRIIMTMISVSTVLLSPLARLTKRSVMLKFVSIIFCANAIVTNIWILFKYSFKIIYGIMLNER